MGNEEGYKYKVLLYKFFDDRDFREVLQFLMEKFSLNLFELVYMGFIQLNESFNYMVVLKVLKRL